jgi:hypothetical protein
MTGTSAHRVDHVFPDVPVRTRVSSFALPLRLLVATRSDAPGRCLAVIVRIIQSHLTRRAGLPAGWTAHGDVPYAGRTPTSRLSEYPSAWYIL